MAESLPSQPYLQNEEAAYAFFEARVWPRGPVCPHCGGTESFVETAESLEVDESGEAFERDM